MEHDVTRSSIGHLLSLALGPTVYVEFGVAVIAFVVWIRQGRPGPDALGESVEQLDSRLQ